MVSGVEKGEIRQMSEAEAKVVRTEWLKIMDADDELPIKEHGGIDFSALLKQAENDPSLSEKAKESGFGEAIKEGLRHIVEQEPENASTRDHIRAARYIEHKYREKAQYSKKLLERERYFEISQTAVAAEMAMASAEEK